jgi:hypothetical protein
VLSLMHLGAQLCSYGSINILRSELLVSQGISLQHLRLLNLQVIGMEGLNAAPHAIKGYSFSVLSFASLSELFCTASQRLTRTRLSRDVPGTPQDLPSISQHVLNEVDSDCNISYYNDPDLSWLKSTSVLRSPTARAAHTERLRALVNAYVACISGGN